MSGLDRIVHTYKTDNVVKHFELPEGSKSNFLVIPLTEALIERFLIKIPENEKTYGISDSQHRNSSSPNRFNPYNFDCDYVIEGKIVNVSTWGRTDIDLEDMDEWWYCVEQITFSGGEVGVRRLYSRFCSFVKTQNLNELKEAAKRMLLEGKHYHLSFEMREFYNL